MLTSDVTTNITWFRTQPRPKRQKRGVLVVLLAALVIVGIGVPISRAWQQTALREASLPELQAQSTRAKDNGPFMALLGGRLAEAHQAQAADALRYAISDGENKAVVWQTLAAAVAAQGDMPRALADLQLGARLPSNTPDLEAALARANALGPSPAPAALAQAIAPAGPEPLVQAYTYGSFLNGLVFWWGRLHPEESGFTTRQEWAHQEPTNAQAQRLWGLALLTNSRLSEAGPVLAHAVALAPRSPAAHLAFAQALEQGGFVGKAAVEYITSLELRPDWLPALLGLGRTSLQADLKYARPAFLQATQLAPTSEAAWLGLGRADLQDNTDLSGALTAFRTAAQISSTPTDFADDYAEALCKNDHPQQAASLLRRRLATDPNDPLAHYRLAEALLDGPTPLSLLAQAEEQTRQALQLQPHTMVAERQLGQILLDENQSKPALAALSLAEADGPYDVTTLHLLSRADGRLGHFAQATVAAQHATQLYNAEQQINVLENEKDQKFLDPQLHQELVKLYLETGQKDKAAQEDRMLHMLLQHPQQTARSVKASQKAAQHALNLPVNATN